MQTKYVVARKFEVEYSIKVNIYFSLTTEVNEEPFTNDLDKAFALDTEAEANRLLDLIDAIYDLKEKGFATKAIPFPNENPHAKSLLKT